ncbi:MAG: 2,3-diaminopropionate biosynthesis protein SbnB [Telmatospirillum sp.]|nr:2,3-diaminopropionate biosynthesis protein SbnB [Telmatospirillum sp.]
MTTVRSFSVVPGGVITTLLRDAHRAVEEIVRTTYLWHDAGRTINPDSYFLRFDDKPEARIIALPAALKAPDPVSGLKWIASYPRNIETNRQRASAVLILNDYETGYPLALLEASQISAARTAASATLAAGVLGDGKRMPRLGVVGAGVIARTILDYLRAGAWTIGDCLVHDLNAGDAGRLAVLASTFCASARTASLAETLAGASHVLFATTAAAPYIEDRDWLRPGQIVLNISLRDLAPHLLLDAINIFDDIDHCMKASTSPHLAEQMTGNRDFATGTLADVLAGRLRPDRRRPIIFSPFGLGVLDIAVGRYLLDQAVARSLAITIPDFLPDGTRWQASSGDPSDES